MKITNDKSVAPFLAEASIPEDGYITLVRIGSDRKEAQVARLELSDGIAPAAWLTQELVGESASPDESTRFRLRHHAPGGARISGAHFTVEGLIASSKEAAAVKPLLSLPSQLPAQVPGSTSGSLPGEPVRSGPSPPMERNGPDLLARPNADLEHVLGEQARELRWFREDLAESRKKERASGERCHRAELALQTSEQAQLRAEVEAADDRKALHSAEQEVEELQEDLRAMERINEALADQIEECVQLFKETPKWARALL
jgi:hypothetical protein